MPAASSDRESEMRTRILGAAFKAFTENGYAGTSTLQIATRATVSKRDLYTLFPSKQAMLLACIRTRADNMRMPAGLPVPRTREALAATLTAFGKNLLAETFHPAVVAMFRLAISEAGRSPAVAKAIDACREAARHAVGDVLSQAQSSGLLATGDALDMADRFLALLRGDLMMSLLLGVASRPGPARIEERAAKATSIFLEIYSDPRPEGSQEIRAMRR